MTMRTTKPIRREARDRGFTLTEMLVTIMVFSLVTGSITAVVVTTMKHQNSLSDRASAIASVRNAIEQVDRSVRSANPLCYATGTEITMLETNPKSGVSNATIIVDYTLSGSSLIYTQYSTTQVAAQALNPQKPAALSCSLSTLSALTNPSVPIYEYQQLTTRTILRNIVTTGTSAVFLDASATTNFDECPQVGSTTGTAPNATTAAAAQQISTLAVNLSVKPKSLSKAVRISDCGTYLYNYVHYL